MPPAKRLLTSWTPTSSSTDSTALRRAMTSAYSSSCATQPLGQQGLGARLPATGNRQAVRSTGQRQARCCVVGQAGRRQQAGGAGRHAPSWMTGGCLRWPWLAAPHLPRRWCWTRTRMSCCCCCCSWRLLPAGWGAQYWQRRQWQRRWGLPPPLGPRLPAHCCSQAPRLWHLQTGGHRQTGTAPDAGGAVPTRSVEPSPLHPWSMHQFVAPSNLLTNCADGHLWHLRTRHVGCRQWGGWQCCAPEE